MILLHKGDIVILPEDLTEEAWKAQDGDEVSDALWDAYRSNADWAPRPVFVYILEVKYPEGSDQPSWRPALWSDPAFLQTLSPRQRRELRRTEFRWPREHMYLSGSGANRRAATLHMYGAEATVHRSYPVVWPAPAPGEAVAGYDATGLPLMEE